MKILFFPRAELLVQTPGDQEHPWRSGAPEYINATRTEISYRHQTVINSINYYDP